MTKPKAEFNPNPSPHWIKNVLAEDEAQRWRDAGLLPDGEAIDRRVTQDLILDDARIRERKPRRPVPRKKRKDAAAVIAKEQGLDFWRAESEAARKRIVERALSPWQRALRARIRQLIATMPGSKWKQGQEPDRLYPAFADAFCREFLAFQSNTGEYENIPERNRHSKFSRFCEDLADRSTGILGPWRRGNV